MTNKLKTTAVDKYSQLFSQKLTAQFFAEHTSITGKQILSFSPVQQVNLFILYYLFKQWKEETGKLQSPYFDYESPEAKEALAVFMNTLSQYISVRQEHFEPLVEQATTATIKLLFSPYSFYEKLLRNKENTIISVETLKETSRYIQINKNIMKELVEQLDSEHQQNIYVTDALVALDKVYAKQKDFVEPIDAYIPMFSQVEAFYPQSFWTDEPDKALQINVVEKADESVLPSIPATTPTTTTNTFQVDIEQFASAANKPPVSTPPVSTPPVSAPPAVTSPATTLSVQEQKSLNQKFSKEQLTLNDRLKREQQATLLDKHQRKKIDDIKSAITLNQKFVFIQSLFKGDSVAFNQALTDIDEASDYHSATNLLKEKYASRYNWDMQSEEVASFLEVVERKFY